MILQIIVATPNGNYHSFIAKLPDKSFLIKYVIKDSIFEEKLGRINIQRNSAISAFSNIWYIEAGCLSNDKVPSRYIKSTYGNWDNYNHNNGLLSNIADNENLESKAEDWDKLYDIID